jgi:hypothetical protein
MDLRGSAKPPEKRKVGGSTPPLTTIIATLASASELRKRMWRRFTVSTRCLTGPSSSNGLGVAGQYRHPLAMEGTQTVFS